MERNVELYYNLHMIIFKHSKELQSYLQKMSAKVAVTGFVPTMGALHRGHLSLIEQSKKATQLTICSIFVNPVQFNNREDFIKYPVTVEQDIRRLEAHGCDILFLPSESEIYPDETSKNKKYDLGYLETILEGKFRPGHFQGVCLVVEKLLDIIDPDYLFMGQKDFQQCLVLKKLIEIIKSNVHLVVCPTLREESGLAMSSRNLRLNTSEKKLAPELYSTLKLISEALTSSNFCEIRKKAVRHLEKNGFKIEYLEMAKARDLQLITKFESRDGVIILIAAFLNEIRLIDNLLLSTA